MHNVAITGTGVFTPSEVITNDELVASFNAYADLYNAENAAQIAAGELEAKPQSSADFIFAASGIERRYVLNKSGVLDPTRMFPKLAQRDDETPGYMAEIGVDACKKSIRFRRLRRIANRPGDLRGLQHGTRLPRYRRRNPSAFGRKWFRIRHERRLLVGNLRNPNRL